MPVRVALLPERRSPRPMLHVELMCSTMPSATWREWRELRGGGARSWVRWAVSGGSINQDEQHQLDHRGYSAEGRCHVFQRIAYCFCPDDIAHWHEAQIRRWR